MKIHTVCSEFIAFSLSGAELMGESEATDFVREQLRESLLPCWHNISVEVFAGSGEALYLAHPLDSMKISIAPFLMPFIEEYFTE